MTAGIIKDAGDDPDVMHGAMIKTTVAFSNGQTGIVFKAGEGVGRITKPGLPLDVGQAAINPVPRQMISASINEFGLHPIIQIEMLKLKYPIAERQSWQQDVEPTTGDCWGHIHSRNYRSGNTLFLFGVDTFDP